MEIIKEDFLNMIAGASGAYDPSYAGAGARQSQHGGGRGSSNGGAAFDPWRPDVITCNNGIIGGMVAGAAGGVVGLALGLAGGAMAGNCFSNGNGGGGGRGSSSNCSDNSCSW